MLKLANSHELYVWKADDLLQAVKKLKIGPTAAASEMLRLILIVAAVLAATPISASASLFLPTPGEKVCRDFLVHRFTTHKVDEVENTTEDTTPNVFSSDLYQNESIFGGHKYARVGLTISKKFHHPGQMDTGGMPETVILYCILNNNNTILAFRDSDR